MYRFLCSDTRVILGPYHDDDWLGWLRAVRTMREVHNVADPGVVRADTREQAQARLSQAA